MLYLSLASNAGDSVARTILGTRHLTGQGVPRCCSCAVNLLLPVAKDIIKSAVMPSGAPQLERRRITRAMAAGFTKSEHRDFQSDSDVFACVLLLYLLTKRVIFLQIPRVFLRSRRHTQHHAGGPRRAKHASAVPRDAVVAAGGDVSARVAWYPAQLH